MAAERPVRRLHGTEHYASPSRFLGEIPEALLTPIRSQHQWHTATPIAAYTCSEPPAGGMRLGQRVRHDKFGDGVVLNYEGRGEHARVQVNFEGMGVKWLVVAYANLQSL